MTYIKIKTGRGDPSSFIHFGEPAFDTSNNILWIGKNGVNVPFYSGVNPSVGYGVNQTYVDGSLGYRDVSILNIWTKIRFIDTSLNSIWTNINGLTLNSSVNNSLAQFIKSSSTGFGLYWNNGLLDVSVNSGTGDVTKAYVDASLAIRDSSITELYSMVSYSFDILDGGAEWSTPNINIFDGGSF